MGTDISHFKSDDLPAHGISWDKARAFCRGLNAKLGLSDAEGYRLPTEAEWEYAARAGTRTEFGLGETITLEITNYHIDYLYGEEPKGLHKEPVPVGSLGVANAWGLFDLDGNVREWCEDDWHSSYEGAPVDGSAWINMPNRTRNRVVRGGSWIDYARIGRSAARGEGQIEYPYGNMGIRLARTAFGK
jgi:formylglycine-generating enzyme required for sulfatase activity